jgi:hypothetical protein
MVETKRVRAKAHVYTAPGVHAWKPGAEFDLPADHADELAALGHIEHVTPEVAPTPAPAPAAA